MGPGFSTFFVSETCYPRYAYTKSHVTVLMKRKRKLLESMSKDLQEEKYLMRHEENKNEVIVDVLKSNREQIISERDLLIRDGTINKENEVRSYSKDFRNDLKKLQRKLERLQVRKTALVNIYQRFAGNTYRTKIAVVQDKKEQNTLLNYFKTRKKNGQDSYEVCLRHDLCKEICMALEIKVFEEMKASYEALRFLLDRSKRFDKRSYAEKSRPEISDDFFALVCKVSDTSIIHHEDEIEQLLGDICGMYSRSHVPKNERPNFAEREKTISTELLKDLKSLSKLISKCGYHYNTLYIFVDAETPETKLANDIYKVVDRHNIKKYSIVSSFVKEYAACASGSKTEIYPDTQSRDKKYGTLAGYVRTDDGEYLCALMARHVAKISHDRTVYISNMECTVRGEIMREVFAENNNRIESQNSDGRTGRVLDVAVAYIDGSERNKCDFNYATENAKPVRGVLCELEPHQMKGLNVHTWGATTAPGLGKVAVSKLKSVQQISSDDESLIIVEDRNTDNDQAKITFCQKGDSGSMVCTDDPDTNGEMVQLISTVIGGILGKDGLYATVKLKDGIEQIENETGMKLQICK